MNRPYAFALALILSLCFLIHGCGGGSGSSPDSPAKVFQNATIPAAGGTIALADGITLVVPAGAVAADTAVQIRKIDPQELLTVFSERGIDPAKVIAGFEALPDGLTFQKPITVRFSGIRALNGAIPVIHYVDFKTNAYQMAGTEASYDPSAGVIDLKVSHFSGVSAEELENLKAAEYCEDNCRCKKLTVKSEAGDVACSEGNCQIVDNKVSVTFDDCEPPYTEVSYIQEISAGCAPKISLTTGKSTLKTGESTSGTAKVCIGCKALKDQSITFSRSGPVSLSPTDAMSDAEGKGSTTITAGETEGKATVTAASTVSYNTYWIYAQAGGVEEKTKGPLKTKSVSASKEIMVSNAETSWHVTFEAEFQPISGSYDMSQYMLGLSMGSYSLRYEFDIERLPEYESRGYYEFSNFSEEDPDIPAIPADAYQMISNVSVDKGTSCSACIENMNAPSTFTLDIYGVFNYCNNTLYFFYDPRPFTNNPILGFNLHASYGNDCDEEDDINDGIDYVDKPDIGYILTDGAVYTGVSYYYMARSRFIPAEGGVEGTYTLTVQANRN